MLKEIAMVSDAINMHEDESGIVLRKQKILENPIFKEDIEFISQQLDLIKKQRDIYKALLDQYEISFPICLDQGQRAISLDNNNFLINDNEFKNDLIDPFSPSYGNELGDRIDKLNFQIRDLKQAFEQKSATPSPLKRPKEITLESSSILKVNKVEENVKREKCKSIDLTKKLSEVQEPKKKTLSRSFHFEKPLETMENPYKYSFCKIQAQIEYFPLRIKELENENKQLEEILEKLKAKDLTQSTLSADQPKRKNTSNLLDVKKKELEVFQKQLEERSKVLDLKEKELNEREVQIKKKKKVGERKNKDQQLVNNINISNIANPNNSQIREADNHYDQKNDLKKIMQPERNKANDEVPEKIYACKICKIF